jgi:hypothetical protein
MKVFDDLGARIEEAWRRADYDEARFPGIATEALAAASPASSIDHAAVLDWVFEAHALPHQDDLEAKFGHPPITVFAGRRFYIQVLMWLEGSTSIHRHGFSGAFQLLDGTSLHARYRFDPRRRVSSRMLVGDLRLDRAELLAKGDVVPITNDLIHALFHLEVPSATVVVRTYAEDEAAPQYDYRPPCLALDPFDRDPVLIRKLQALAFARRADPARFVDRAAALAERSDLETCFEVLLDARRAGLSTSRLAPLFDAARRRHGPVIDDLAAVLHEDLRDRKIRRLRASRKEPDLRFFLALLQNLPDRDSIHAMIAQRYPGAPPRERVEAWTRALSGVDAIGVDLDDPLTRHLFGALLDGCSHEETLARLASAFPPADVAAQADAIARHRERIRRTALAPLFRAPGAAC